MSFLSQAPPLRSLSLLHGAFQEHAAHTLEWSKVLHSKGSMGTCIPKGVSTFFHAACTAHRADAVGSRVTVGGRIAPPTSASKPCVPVSRHTAPQWEGSCHEHPGGLVICMFTPSYRVAPPTHPYLTRARRFIVSWALPTPTTSLPPSPRQHIVRLSRTPSLLGESLPVP